MLTISIIGVAFIAFLLGLVVGLSIRLNLSFGLNINVNDGEEDDYGDPL